MARYDRRESRDEGYPKQPETVVEQPKPVLPPQPTVVAEKSQVGDVIIVKILGRGPVTWIPAVGKLSIAEGTTVWVAHRDISDYKFVSTTEFKNVLCLSGKPTIIRLDKEAFKKGIYALA